jgi:hypothetical protein
MKNREGIPISEYEIVLLNNSVVYSEFPYWEDNGVTRELGMAIKLLTIYKAPGVWMSNKFAERDGIFIPSTQIKGIQKHIGENVFVNRRDEDDI